MSGTEELHHILKSVLGPPTPIKQWRKDLDTDVVEVGGGKGAEKRKTNRASSSLFLGSTCLSSAVHQQAEAVSKGISCPSSPENSELLHLLPLPTRAENQHTEGPWSLPHYFLSFHSSSHFLSFFFSPKAFLSLPSFSFSTCQDLLSLPPDHSHYSPTSRIILFQSRCPWNGYILNLKFNLQIVFNSFMYIFLKC